MMGVCAPEIHLFRGVLLNVSYFHRGAFPGDRI